MIVENCPAYYKNLGCMGNKICYTDCEKENDCIIKQLIKKHPELAKTKENNINVIHI